MLASISSFLGVGPNPQEKTVGESAPFANMDAEDGAVFSIEATADALFEGSQTLDAVNAADIETKPDVEMGELLKREAVRSFEALSSRFEGELQGESAVGQEGEIDKVLTPARKEEPVPRVSPLTLGERKPDLEGAAGKPPVEIDIQERPARDAEPTSDDVSGRAEKDNPVSAEIRAAFAPDKISADKTLPLGSDLDARERRDRGVMQMQNDQTPPDRALGQPIERMSSEGTVGDRRIPPDIRTQAVSKGSPGKIDGKEVVPVMSKAGSGSVRGEEPAVSVGAYLEAKSQNEPRSKDPAGAFHVAAETEIPKKEFRERSKRTIEHVLREYSAPNATKTSHTPHTPILAKPVLSVEKQLMTTDKPFSSFEPISGVVERFDTVATHNSSFLKETEASLHVQDPRQSNIVRGASRQIVDSIRLPMDGSIEIRLSPEDLGRVKLSFVPGDTGLVIQMTAERGETLDLLRRHADILASDLLDAGYEGLEFSFGPEDSSEHWPEETEDFLSDGSDVVAVQESAKEHIQLHLAGHAAGLDIRL